MAFGEAARVASWTSVRPLTRRDDCGKQQAAHDACRRVALIDVSAYPAETGVPSSRLRAVCAKQPWEQDRRAAEMERATARLMLMATPAWRTSALLLLLLRRS